MKTNFKALSLCIMAAVLLCSCNENQGSLQTGSRKARFDMNIGRGTRTVSDGLGTSWVDGDKVGVFSLPQEVADNVELRKVGSIWNGQDVILPEGQDVTFYAYYPYDSKAEGTTFTHSVDLDQSNGYNHSDLLIARDAVANAENPVVKLDFEHALALVEVVASSIENISTVSLQAAAVSTVNILTPKVVTDLSRTEEIKFQHIGNGVFRAIMPEQMLKNSELKLGTSDGKEANTTIDAANLTLGSRNRFTVSVMKEGQIYVEFETGSYIHDWGDVEGGAGNLVKKPVSRLPIGTDGIVGTLNEEGWFCTEPQNTEMKVVMEDDGFKSIYITKMKNYSATRIVGYTLAQNFDPNTTIEVTFEVKAKGLLPVAFDVAVSSDCIIEDCEYFTRVGSNYSVSALKMETGKYELDRYYTFTEKWTLNKLNKKTGNAAPKVIPDGTVLNNLNISFANGRYGSMIWRPDNEWYMRNLTVTVIGPGEE